MPGESLINVIDDIRFRIKNSPETVTIDDLLLTNYSDLRQQDDSHYISYKSLAEIITHNSDIVSSDLSRFKDAYDYAIAHHQEQKRKHEKIPGKEMQAPFYYHLDRVMLMIAVFGVSKASIGLMSEAVLHDVLDNAPKNKDRTGIIADLILNFGKDMTQDIVSLSDKEKKSHFIEQRQVKRKHMSEILSHGSYNIDPWIIHVIDRIDNLRDGSDAYKFSKLQMKLEESWTYYLPIAHALNQVLGNIMIRQLIDSSPRQPEILIPGNKIDICGLDLDIYAPNAYLVFKALKSNLDPKGLNYFDESKYPLTGYTSADGIMPSYDICDNFDRNAATRVCDFLSSKIYFGYDRGSTYCLEDSVDYEYIKDKAHLPGWVSNLKKELSKNDKLRCRLFRSKIGLLGYEITIDEPRDEEAVVNSVEEAIFTHAGARIAYYYGSDLSESKARSEALYYFPNENDPTESPRLLRIYLTNGSDGRLVSPSFA